MDPYLERFWPGVHARLVVYAAEQLEAQLPEELYLQLEERLLLADSEGTSRQIRPDTYVVEHPRRADYIREPGGVALAEPIVLRFSSDPERQSFLEIRAASGGRLITAVEFLSPANKRTGAGREEYLQKQEEVLASGASLVEIDLTRAGSCVLAVPARRIPEAHRATYYACVRRGWRHAEAELYPIQLQEPLPSIRVPLRPGDEDIRLDIQALVSRYFLVTRRRPGQYEGPLEPPLGAEEQAWVASILAASRSTDSPGAPVQEYGP
jgi:hypothetical protein